ncbi:MAG: lipopolysaccharide biosynthesis protein [Chitinophagaceae bacterium]
MGIVRKQSFISSIFMYGGVVIGALNVMVLFPKFFTLEAFGLYNVLLECSVFFATIITLGSLTSFVKFYPVYASHLKPKENDLPFWTVLVITVSAGLFVLFCFLFPELIEQKFGKNSKLFVDNFYLLLPLTLSFTAILVMEAFCWMIRKTIVSNFVKEVPFRLAVLLLIVLYALHWIDWHQFFLFFSLIYIPGGVILLATIIKDGSVKIVPTKSKVTKRLYKKILTFTSFHFSGLVISILPKSFDAMMLASTNGLESTGVYSMSLYFLALMEIPQRSMMGIASALISEAWKNKNKAKIKEMYHKTSLNLFIVGILIFGVLYPNMDNLVRFEGDDYALIKQLFLVGSIGKLVDMGMGMNQQILGYSKYWRIDFFTSAIFVVLTVAVNYWSIHQWGTIGAAIGNTICLTGFNLLRFFYNWKLFRLQPFTKNTVYAALIGIAALLPTLWLPYIGNMYVDAAVRVVVFGGLFGLGILYFKISSDFSDMHRMFVERLKTKK